MNARTLKEKFLNFFKDKNHLILPSALLVPHEVDPSVLFNTAGMQQFKRFYLEPNEAPSPRVTTSQKCIRTGDIDEVGDKTHHTFFEMLGNFSFGYPEKDGSYFKQDAIKLAWQFLTEELAVDKSRIYATYFKGENSVAEDKQSLEILKTIEGLREIKPQGFEDNFWSLGTEGSPGGPTVEFYIDGVEVWNLVFNEYIFMSGRYEPAQYKGVDTGMGFERLAAMVQGKGDNYQSDLFWPMIEKISQLCSKAYEQNEINFRIIADHIKAAVFIINDGVEPSNKDRGYVLRRLIRRAVVKAHKLGLEHNFTLELSKEVYKIYQNEYEFNQILIDEILAKEEQKFRNTLKGGLRLMQSKKNISGEDLFNLYQSFGLPLEIALEEAKNQNLTVESSAVEQYQNLLRKHQEKSRTASAGMFKGGLAGSGEMTTKYHTATHLLLAALRKVLGPEVHQKGANITDERIRFDFSWPEKLTPEQIEAVQDSVNKNIEADLPVSMEQMKLEDAQACGALGDFSHKYAETIKVYTIGPSNPDGRSGSRDFVSREICGGPHVENTGVLGHFKILKEESSSSGVRRIKAVLE